MRNLRWSLLLMLFVLLSPSAHGGPFPWPWPWSYCKIEWKELQGRHNIFKDTQGETFVFHTSRVSKKSLVNVHISRIDANGVRSDGLKLVTKKEEEEGLISVDMASENGESYTLKFGMAYDLDRGARPNAGCEEPMKPQIMITPSGQSAEKNYYVLDPALRF